MEFCIFGACDVWIFGFGTQHLFQVVLCCFCSCSAMLYLFLSFWCFGSLSLTCSCSGFLECTIHCMSQGAEHVTTQCMLFVFDLNYIILGSLFGISLCPLMCRIRNKA